MKGLGGVARWIEDAVHLLILKMVYGCLWGSCLGFVGVHGLSLGFCDACLMALKPLLSQKS